MNTYYKKMNSNMLPAILLKPKPYQVLNFLSLHPDASFYEKEISEYTNVSRGATNQILNDFHKSNLVSRERRGKMWLYSLQPKPFIKYFRIYVNLVEISALVAKLSSIAKRIILFGSAASGTDTSESDIDLFVLTSETDKARQQIQNFRSQRKIKPVILNSVEYATSQAKDKAFFEQVKKGIVLFEKETDEQRL